MEFGQKYNITMDYSAVQIHGKAASGNVGAQILLHCVKKWNPDYSMINWCLRLLVVQVHEGRERDEWLLDATLTSAGMASAEQDLEVS
jgi:hypothetical protein